MSGSSINSAHSAKNALAVVRIGEESEFLSSFPQHKELVLRVKQRFEIVKKQLSTLVGVDFVEKWNENNNDNNDKHDENDDDDDKQKENAVNKIEFSEKDWQPRNVAMKKLCQLFRQQQLQSKNDDNDDDNDENVENRVEINEIAEFLAHCSMETLTDVIGVLSVVDHSANDSLKSRKVCFVLLFF